MFDTAFKANYQLVASCRFCKTTGKTQYENYEEYYHQHSHTSYQ